MVITKQKPTGDAKNIESKESRHITREKYQPQRKTAREEERNKRSTKRLENDKPVVVKPIPVNNHLER